MWKHLQSATKLVLLLLMMTLCLLVMYIVAMNVEKENVILPIILAFPNILLSVGAFYFGKGQAPQPGSVTVTPTESVSEVKTSVETSTQGVNSEKTSSDISTSDL